MIERVARAVVRRVVQLTCRRLALWRLDLCVEGQEHVPTSGPLVIASRHYHHVWDGCVLLAATPRPLALMVALDWIPFRWFRVVMELACRSAGWVAIVRADGPSRTGRSAYTPGEGNRYLRRAVRAVTALLRAGEAIVIFPEAYPNIDPVFTRKRPSDEFLPFRPGFVRLVEWADRAGSSPVAVVPSGFQYRRIRTGRGRRWDVTLRFGPPLYLQTAGGRDALLRSVEEQVRILSLPGYRERTPQPASK